MIKLFWNQYRDANPWRQMELERAARFNAACHPIGQRVPIPGRPDFSEMLEIMREATKQGDVAILANSDIFFDGTIEQVERITDRECWALSRWEYRADGTIVPFHRKDTQDAWIFRGPPPKIDAPFAPGTLGCDNRLAWLIKNAGKTLLNPSQSVHAIHLHLSNVRHYERGKSPQVAGPYEFVHATALPACAA